MLTAQAHRRRLFDYRVPHDRPQHQGDADQQQKARQVLRGAELRPLQPDLKAAAFGIPELLLDGRMPIL